MKSKKNKLFNSLLKITLASGLIVTTGALVLKNGEEQGFENISIFNQRNNGTKIAAPTEFEYDSASNTWSVRGSLGADYPDGNIEILSGAEEESGITWEETDGIITSYTISGLSYNKTYDSITLHYRGPNVAEDIVIDSFTITETEPTIIVSNYDESTSFNSIKLIVNFNENSNSQIIDTDIDVNGSNFVGTETTDGTFEYSITGLNSNSSYEATLNYDWGWDSAQQVGTLSTNAVDEISDVNITSITPTEVQGDFTYVVNNEPPADFTAESNGNALDITTEQVLKTNTYTYNFTISGLVEGTDYSGTNNIIIKGNDATANLTDFTTPFTPKFEFSEVTPNYEYATFNATLTNPVELGYDKESFEWVMEKGGVEYTDFTVTSNTGNEWVIQINGLDSDTTYTDTDFSIGVKYSLDTTIDPNYSTETFTTTPVTLPGFQTKKKDEIASLSITNVSPTKVNGTIKYHKNDREGAVSFTAKDSLDNNLQIYYELDSSATTEGEPDTYNFEITGLEEGKVYSGVEIKGEYATSVLNDFETPKRATFTFTPIIEYYDIKYNIVSNDVATLDYYDPESFKLFINNYKTNKPLNKYVTKNSPGNWTISLPEANSLESSTEYEIPEVRIEYNFLRTEGVDGNYYTPETQVVESGPLGSLSTLSSNEEILIDEFVVEIVPGAFEKSLVDSTLNVSFDVVIPVIEEVESEIYNFATLPEVVNLNVKSYSVYDGSELSDEDFAIELFNHRKDGIKIDNSSINSSNANVESYNEENKTITYNYNKDFTITDELTNNRKYEFDLEVISTNKTASGSKAEYSLETDPNGYSELPSSAFFNIEVISEDEIYLSYNYMVNHYGTDYTKPDEVIINVSVPTQVEGYTNRESKEITIETPGLNDRVDITDELNGFVIDEESEFTVEILGINIGGTQFGTDSIINTPIINVVMPQLTYYDIHKLIWLIILIVIAIAATTGTLVYIEWPKNEEEIREKINRDELTPEGIANKYGLSLTEHSTIINKVLQVEKDVKNIRLLAVAARADAAREKRKSEEQRELEAREKVKKSIIPSVDFIHENVDLGRKQINADEELKTKLDGWLVAFDGITENMVRDIGVTMINPTPGAEFNDEEHIKVGEIAGQEVKLGSVALVNKVGFKTDEGLIRKAEVTIAIYALPNQNANNGIEGREV